jgi:citrate synthase
MARSSGVAGEGVAFMEALQEAVAARIRPLPINVDGSSAAVLFDLGFPPPLAKLLFILGRVGGLTAQVHEELTRERPMRLKVAVEYDGPAARALPSDETPQ